MAESGRRSGGNSQAKEAFQILQDLSKLLNTGLDEATLSICVKLCESGVNPEALATIIKELRKEATNLRDTSTSSDHK